MQSLQMLHKIIHLIKRRYYVDCEYFFVSLWEHKKN